MPSLPFLFIAALFFVPPPVTVSVYPQVTNDAVRPRVIIEKHQGNRLLVLEAVRFGIFSERYTEFQINGAQSQRVFTPTPLNKCICWYRLPPGEYQAVATLVRIIDGHPKTYRDARLFQVIGSEP